MVEGKYQREAGLAVHAGLRVCRDRGGEVGAASAVKPGDAVMGTSSCGALRGRKCWSTRRSVVALPADSGRHRCGLADRVRHGAARAAGSGTHRCGRDAAGAGCRRRRGARRSADRQAAGRDGHRRRFDRGEARAVPAPGARMRRSTTRPQDLKERVRALTDGRGVDVVYDAVGGPYAAHALRSVALEAAAIWSIGFAAGEIPRVAAQSAAAQGLFDRGRVLGGVRAARDRAANAGNMQQLWSGWRAASCRPLVVGPLPSGRRSLRSPR